MFLQQNVQSTFYKNMYNSSRKVKRETFLNFYEKFLSLMWFQVTDSIYDLVGAEVPARLKSQNVERVFCNMDTDKDGVISLEAGENILQLTKILMKIFFQN